MLTTQSDLRNKLTGALWGYFAGDAYSMPVHWYYDPKDILKDFGKNGITDYEAPKARHPGSIMSLHSTGGACRGEQKGDIVGDVILKGKKHLWGQKNIHYHHEMQKGENTLNYWIVRQLFQSFKEKKQYDSQDFLQKFYNFMTTKDSHPDTYAESFIRGFFKRYQEGYKLQECTTPENHDTPSMGGLMFVVPMVVYGVGQNKTLEQTTEMALNHLRLTHQSKNLEKYAQIYIKLFYNVLKDANSNEQFDKYIDEASNTLKIDMNQLIQQVNAKNYPDYSVVGPVFTSACYVDGGVPSSLFLLKRHFSKGLKSTLLANTNAGGENCYRGGCIGAILGGYLGESNIEKDTIQGLARYNDLKVEIDEFVDLCLKQ